MDLLRSMLRGVPPDLQRGTSGTGAGDESLDRALRACLRRFGRRELLKTADAVLLGGALRKARLRHASRTAGITRIDSSPPR
jgi:hypothetical protein